MAITDYKVTSSEIVENRIRNGGAPDILRGTPDANKQVFDRLSLLIADKYNDALDALVGEFASQTGYTDAVYETVQTEIDNMAQAVTPLNPKGMYATLSDLQDAHPTGNAGDAWLVGTSSSNTAYIWDVDAEEWKDVGGLVDSNGFKSAYNKSFEASTSNIKANGTANVGVLTTIPRADHVHPSDTTKADLVSGFVDDEQLLSAETITAWQTILGISEE